MDPLLLLSCEDEKLHLSGAIQPHGALVALGPDSTVTHASENLADYLGTGPAEILGSRLPAPWLAQLAGLGLATGSQLRFRSVVSSASVESLPVVATRTQSNVIILELFPCEAGGLPPFTWTSEPDPQLLLQVLARHMPGDRLMYYQFRNDGDGEVVAEVRAHDDLAGYLGLRFPASDIPRIARELYLKNPWRLIPDARLQPVRLLGIGSRPLDLTWSDLRSVSPAHCTYLANMGVAGSLSIPIVVQGRLEALISCHHRERLTAPMWLLEWARGVVSGYQLRLQRSFASEAMRLVDDAAWRWEVVVASLGRVGDDWRRAQDTLINLFSADSVAVKFEGEWHHSGGLSTSMLQRLELWLSAQASPLVSTDCLLDQGFDRNGQAVCGLMSIAFGRRKLGNWLLLLRAEHIHEVAWGGPPTKPTEESGGGLRLSPRSSFERWVEKRENRSRPWSRSEELLALQLRTKLQNTFGG